MRYFACDDWSQINLGALNMIKSTDAQDTTLLRNLSLGNFVWSHPPYDILEWVDDVAYDWVDENIWEPFEYWEGREIFSQADSLYRQFREVYDMGYKKGLADSSKGEKE